MLSICVTVSVVLGITLIQAQFLLAVCGCLAASGLFWFWCGCGTTTSRRYASSNIYRE